jgi:hypothetical protein
MIKRILVLVLVCFVSTGKSYKSIEGEISHSNTSYLFNKLYAYNPECLSNNCSIFLDTSPTLKKIDKLFGNVSSIESYLNRIVWAEYLTRIIKKNKTEFLFSNNGENIASFTNLMNGNVRFGISFIKKSNVPESYLFFIDPSKCHKNMSIGLEYPTIFNKKNHFGKKFPTDTIKLKIIEKNNEKIIYTINNSQPREFFFD